MSLRLFMDQCVPRSVSESLHDAGHAVELLRNHMPINAKDPDVIVATSRDFWAYNFDANALERNINRTI